MKNIMLFLMTLLMSSHVMAQESIVTGTITDANDGSPLIGANVLVKDAGVGSIADTEGRYSVNVPKGKNALVFSCIGYKEQTITLKPGQRTLNVRMAEDTELLDELVCHLKCPGDFETAALITTTEEEAFDLSRLLQLRGINVSYVDRNSSAFKKGLTVTTFYLAKGLEFDQVFALRGAKENPLKNQAEYICATRALHELYVYEIADSLSK